MGQPELARSLASHGQDILAASTHPSWQLPDRLEPILKWDGEECENTKAVRQKLSTRKDPFQLIFQFKHSFLGCETVEVSFFIQKNSLCKKNPTFSHFIP